MKRFTLFIFCILISGTLVSQVRLPKLISNGMVLQRDTDIKIWGWSNKNEKISMQFMNSTYKGSADDEGNWAITLSGLKPGGPYNMELNAGDTTVILSDIMVGDVWICSGQSNMEVNMKRVSPLYASEIANSENPYIRYFEVPDNYNFISPQKDLSSGKWEKANPNSVLNFGAVCYFFGKEIYEKYKVPIGLINSALGGSPAECWISEETLKQFPEHYKEAQRYKDSSLILQIQNEDKIRINDWNTRIYQNDEGYKNPQVPWYSTEYNSSDWPVMEIPGYWANTTLGPVNGVVWFRKEVNIPAPLAGKEAHLLLGRIIDADSVYVNGIFVGTTSYQYPPRRYTIPPSILKEGKNIVVVRVINSSGTGGFVEEKPYEIIIEDKTIDLKGDWQFHTGVKMEPLKGETFIRWKPVGLYNAMIAPLINTSIKGVIWYQGESNADRANEYISLFPALIKDWRLNWKQGDFPFLFAQLPNFMKAESEPSENSWAYLREAQLKALSVPNTGMAVTIDIGEWNDIHPLNKKDVGKRLALAAEKLAYNDKKVIYSGPIYKSMEVVGNKIYLTFTHAGSGLSAKGNSELKQFAIAGADRKFIWASARIENNRVVVWSDKIPNPVAVRYAWAGNPEGANLYNNEGLPASPFRTDDF